MYLRHRRDRLFASYDRGIITESEVSSAFVALMLDADDDGAALDLCDSLPEWFRGTLRTQLTKLANRDYAYCSFGIGDQRTPEQIAADSKRHQEILSRLGPAVLSLL